MQWADIQLPYMQTIIEATPYEWGESEAMDRLRSALARVSQGDDVEPLENSANVFDAASERFHLIAKGLYGSAGATYVKVRLYWDTIQNSDIRTFVAETRGAFAFEPKEALLRRHIMKPHGTIVRLNRPITKRRKTSGGSEWHGSLLYIEVDKNDVREPASQESKAQARF
jgi:hypothetical protein